MKSSLVARSACFYGSETDAEWIPLVRHVVSLGSPHLGAPLEQAVHYASAALVAIPESKPFGALLRRRSAGIRDLNQGGVVGEDGRVVAATGADLVVLALALTPSTTGLVDEALLERMGPTCHLVNVARGAHVVTDDLVAALRDGVIASAGLDVTDPEPLPDGHPLWSLPNCTLTPHVGNTPRMAVPLLSARITDNVRRWLGGEELVGLVDVELGY